MNDSPPVLIGEKVFWLGSGSGLPKRGKVKWIGKLAEIGPGWTIGVELEEPLPYGGIDGSWGSRKLFSCKQKHGLIVPSSSIVPERQRPPLNQLSMNETSSAFARERASRLERKNFDDEFLKDLSKDGKLKNLDNALVPLHPPQLRPNEARSNLETLRHEYLAQPGITQSRTVQIQQEGVVYSWMVDHQVHHERLRFRGMGFRRRELNRSLDDGLALESPRNSFHSSRSSGSKKDRSSGIFSLFQWFRKQKSEDSSDLDVSSGPNSPVLPRAASITGSADTLFSTATANSFAFVHPLQYRPFGSANQPEIRIAVGPETNTYRNRIRERERLRYQERHISLREKYRLYASGTLPRSADHINELSDERLFDIKQSFDLPGNRSSTLGRKKRKAPPPPSCNNSCSENSLPAVFDQNITETNLVKQHRRSSSEPVKYLKQQCHVKGKRKAPQPPGHNIVNDLDIISLSTTNSNSSKRSKKKRRAPSPPIKKSAAGDEHIVTIIREATDDILSNKNPVSQKEDFRDETLSNASTLDIGSSEDVVCTDTLKLERGILKPNMDKTFPEHKINPSSPVSPRPWYKRTTVNREMGSMREKEKRKERDRRKVEDWMLESGFPRRSILNTDRNSMYTKAEKSDEKRKSQISILTNISELDREAAEIIRRGKEKEKTLIETHNAMYFSNAESVSGNDMVINNIVQETETPKKKSTKELITLFNAITNVTKVTVNSSFFSRDSSNFLSKDKKTKVLNDREINNKPSSSSVREIETVDEIIIKQTSSKNVANPLETDKPGTSSGSSSASGGKIARVTIEELDEYDAERNSKAQVLYEANRQNRHLSPPIPTITEVSEGSAKSSPTSTIASATNSDPVSEPVPEPVHMRHMNVWVCPRCTLENLRWRITCEACDMWRPNPFELRERSNQNQLATKKSTTENKNDIEKKETTSNHIYPNLTKLEVIKTSNSDFNKPPNQENRTDVTKEVKEKEVHESKVNKNTVSENEAKIKVGIDIENVNNKTSVEANKETEGVTTQEKEDNLFDNQTEEVRKARLAFFTKTNLDNKENIQIQSGPVVSKDTNKSTPFIISDDEEKRKLKDMLIEMKHSLPKRPKPVRSSEQGGNEGGNKDKTSSVKPNSSAVKMLKASQPTTKVINVVSNNSTSSENKAEAYLVESETVIEEIKIKKPLEKVSSSVQTSGLIKQISPKPVASSSKEVHIPIKVEENVIKDGILYTTVSKDTRRIGTGTFELLRPRDFANIEAIKTDSKQSPIHLYANIANNEGSDKEVKTEESTLNKLEYIDKLSKQLTRPQGVANFKARMDMSNDKNVNTLAVNRLLKRLEVAIAGGNHELAATLARELAQLKVNCSVIRQKPEAPGQEILVEMFVEDKSSHQGPFPIKLKPSLTVRELKDRIEREYEIPVGVQRWILGKQLAADDQSSLGDMGINTDGCPIFLYLVAPESIQPKLTGEPAITFHIPKLATSTAVNIDISEKDLNEAGPSGVNTKTAAKSNECNQQNAESTPETETKTDLNPVGTLALGWKCVACTLMNSPTRPGCAACTTERPKDYKVPTEYKLSDTEVSRIDSELVNEKETTQAEEEEKAKNYQKLVDLEKDDLIIYTEAFECPVCLTDYPPMDGIVLRECLHVFCRNCIANTIRYSEEAEVKCPFRDNNYTCDSTLLQREIKALVPPEIYEEHLAKSIALAETKIGNAFHCKTPDCKGWCIYEDNVNTFRCPVCTHTNCLTCQAIHEGLDCKQFQEQLNKDSDMNIEAKRTKEMLQEMVDRGEAMNCPTCQVVLMKKWGCDWLRCSMCKTEICWVTRGPRWGPNGKGDTSGGCQCGVNGIKCHPKCTYCH